MVFALGSSVGDDVKWQSAIDRALGTWESVVEWADYISFLSRVQKAIKNKHRCEGSNLPLAPQISEMLARCLEPSLPAGVHQTCIDVYNTVFSTLGPEKLSETINIWLPGLLPVVSWAAFNVKPLIVQLISKYVIPAARINPTELHELYRPLQLSLLQSIEDESSDCYTEICELLEGLNKMSDQSGDLLFWQCLYLCILTSPDSRLGALTYLQKHKPDLKESALFIRAVCGGLEDQNVLVQRGFLDILSKYLPLDSDEIQRDEDDSAKLMLSACKTIYRKDMSLNRRLRLWLMGPEPESTATNEESMSRLEYFQKYAAKTLISVLLAELPKDMASTCAIAQGLMDRWEIGVTIAPPLLKPVLQGACAKNEVEPNVALFFDNTESNIVWNTVINLLEDDQETVLFMVNSFNIQDEDMLNLFIPLTIIYVLADTDLSPLKSEIVRRLAKVLPSQEFPREPSNPLETKTQIREFVTNFFKQSLETSITGEDEEEAEAEDAAAADVVAAMGTDENSSIPTIKQPSKPEISWYLIKLAGDLVLANESAAILNDILSLFPATPGLTLDIPQCSQLIKHLDADSSDGVDLFIHIVDKMHPQQIRHYVQQFTQNLADSLKLNGHRQLERVKELWRIYGATETYVVPSALSTVLANKELLPPHARAKIFTGIWVHSVDQIDVSVMLTKPLLLFMDLEAEDKSLFYAYLQSSVVRTGTAPRMVKLLVDKLDAESRGDDLVFSYVLERFVTVLNNPEIRTAYVTKYAPLVCTLLLEWFDKSLLPEKAYAHALELAELTILDSRIKDGKMWLRRFVDALTHVYIEAQRAEDSDEAATATDSAAAAAPPPPGSASASAPAPAPASTTASTPASVPVALVKFVTAAIPNLDQKTDVRVFIEACITRLNSEVDYEVFNQLLNSLLEVDPQVEDTLLRRIVEKLDALYSPLMNSNLDDIGDNGVILHLISAIESILATGLNATRDGAAKYAGNSGGGLTSALTGFQVESPEDRSRAEASLATLDRCMQSAITESCKFWLFLQRTNFANGLVQSGDYATALHTTGRLKTRIRKLMSLCYAARPTETLIGVASNISDNKLAVRMTHMFEGARVGPTLERLLEVASEGNWRMFEFAAAYVDSLETDVLGDVWPVLNQFLTTIASGSNNSFASSFSGSLVSLTSGSSTSANANANSNAAGKRQEHQYSVLAFLTRSILPRFDQLRLKNRKKYVRELADIYSKLLLADTGDLEVLSAAIQKMSILITEPDRQASLLGRILNSLLKSPQDIAKGADFLNAVSSTFGIAGTAPAKTWTRHVGDFLFETRTEKDLMPMNLEESVKLKPVIKRWVQCDKERVRDFISKLPTYGSSTGVLFGWSGTKELANSNLYRFAYLSVCTPHSVLAINWSKLTNQLASLWDQNAPGVCLLLRSCMLGQPSTTIVAFMAYRLQGVFEKMLRLKKPVTGEDAELLVEACKLVDLALVIGSEQFQPFEWMFISDNGGTVYDYIGQSNDSSEKLSEKNSNEGTTEKSEIDEKQPRKPLNKRAGGILERLVNSPAIPKIPVAEQLVVPTPTFKGKRRPLLPMRATLADLPIFLSQISVASHEEVYSMTVPDREYCEEWLLSDLFH